MIRWISSSRIKLSSHYAEIWLDAVEGYKERIHHDPAPTPEPEEEPTEAE